uniref:hypothetical protein n=1 Tax=Herbidospora sakaeratensis TaxID=564415 RepID=UPI000ABCC161|nr:hypothetical protein [Herbidospora sakaeratensis]
MRYSSLWRVARRRGGVKAWYNNGTGSTGGTNPMADDPQSPPPDGLPLCVANRCW